MSFIPSPISPSSFDNGVDVNHKAEGNIHIRIQQRNGRKTITTVEGLPKEFDLKRILKVFKKDFACNGTLSSDPTYGEIIQLNGDHREKIASFLVDEEIAKKEHIKVHGF